MHFLGYQLIYTLMWKLIASSVAKLKKFGFNFQVFKPSEFMENLIRQ